MDSANENGLPILNLQSFSEQVSTPSQLYSIEETQNFIEETLVDIPIIQDVLRGFINDHARYPMNIISFLRNGSQRNQVIKLLRDTALDTTKTIEEFRMFVDLSLLTNVPFFQSKDEYFNYENNQLKTNIQKKKLLAQNPDLYGIGTNPNIYQQTLLQQFALKLDIEILPMLFLDLSEVIKPFVKNGFPSNKPNIFPNFFGVYSKCKQWHSVSITKS